MPKILVTGGAGFLGSHLVELLIQKGHNVLVMDSFWTSSQDSLTRFKDHGAFELIKHDVAECFPESVGSVDQIYHLACPASPIRFPENPLGILKTCFEGTQNVLELARKCGARVLLASTSEVYGDPLVCPQGEQYWGNVNPFGPRSCYDEGKRVAEALAYAYRHQFNTTIRIARIFNAYGPGLRPDDGRVVSNFIVAALEGKSIDVIGDGLSTRCFQFVTDCVRGLELLMNSDYDGPVNIGSQVETAVIDLADLIGDMVAKRVKKPKIKINYLPKRDDDPFRRKPDTGLAKRVLGWEAEVSLERGLHESIEWYIKNL